jgi:hypothetical protein
MSELNVPAEWEFPEVEFPEVEFPEVELPEATIEFMRAASATANLEVGNAEPNVPDKEAQQGAEPNVLDMDIDLMKSKSYDSVKSGGSGGSTGSFVRVFLEVAEAIDAGDISGCTSPENPVSAMNGTPVATLVPLVPTTPGVTPSMPPGVPINHPEVAQGDLNATECVTKASQPNRGSRIELLRDHKKMPPPLKRATEETFGGDDYIKIHHGVSHFQAGSGKHKRQRSNFAPHRTKIANFVRGHPKIKSVLVRYDQGSGSRTKKQKLAIEQALALKKVPLCRVYGRIKKATIDKLLAGKLETSMKVHVYKFDKEGNPTEAFALVYWSNLHPVETNDFSPYLARMQEHGACVTTKVVTNSLD